MREREGYGFDFGRYIEIILRQWRLIITVTLISAIIVGTISYLQPKIYQARVLIASTKVQSSVSLGSAIETLSEEQLGYRMGGSAARLQSYVEMVRNPVVAEQVIKDLGDQLPLADQNVNNLISRVMGDIVGKSDSIEIIVMHSDPVIAARIANAWGNAYVDQVNEVYTDSARKEAFQSIHRQAVKAMTVYEEAQTALEGFIGVAQIDELTRQINEQQTLINNLSAARGIAATTLISNTMVAQLGVYNEQLLDLQQNLTQAYADSRQIEQLLNVAEDMHDQVQAGGEGAARSNAIALTLLKAQVFAAHDEGIGSLQIQLIPSELTPEEIVTDLGSLIQTLKARQATLNKEIKTFSQQLLELQVSPSTLSLNSTGDETLDSFGGQASMQSFLDLKGLEGILDVDEADNRLEQKLLEIEARVTELQAQSANETSKELELTQARDLAWQTYTTLATKEEELKIASDSLGTEVALAAPAAEPRISSTDWKKSIAFGALVGFLLGIGIAFLIEIWWVFKKIEPKPITVPLKKSGRDSVKKEIQDSNS